MRSGRAASPVAGSDALRRGSLSSIKIWAAVVLVALLVAPAVIGLMVIPTIAQTDKPLPVINPTPAGIPEKFEEAFYEKILNTVSEKSHPRSSSTTPQYYTVVVVVERYGPDGTDVSAMNKARIVGELKKAGAKNIASAETLSFVIASVPVGKIMGLSTHEEVHLLGDGQLPLRSLASNPTVTVNATVAALTTANGIADGSGARVAILESENIDYVFVNDKIILSLDCSSYPCTPASSSPPLGLFHQDAVAHFIGTTGHDDHNGISPGAEIISLASGGVVAGQYYALDWAVSNDVDVVSMSIGVVAYCNENSARYSINVISNDVVLSGTTLISAAGNDGDQGYQTLGIPCSYNIINVGGIDDRGSDITMSSSASRGPYHILDHSTLIATVMKPEIVAPAVRVPVAFPGSGIAVVSGTSYSAPQVSAAVAVLTGENDYLSPEDVRATLFLGANWTGPVPCTSVQFEQNNATDDCSYARQPPPANATSTSILNNVGFGILNVGQSLHYTLQGNGQHVIAGDLLHDDVLEYQFNITNTARPVKVILTWLNNAFDVTSSTEDYPRVSITSGRIYNLDLEVTCPGMDTIYANSTHQNNEFAVFMPSQTGTCTAQVSSSDSQSYDSRKRFALASTILFNVESTPPRISVTSPVNATVITLAVDFGNAIKLDTFTASDVTTSTGTVSEPTTGDNQTFGFNITNTANKDVEISIAAGTVEYVSGNINAEAHTRIERAPPTVVLSTITPSPTKAQSVTFTATFSEPVAFDSGISDISVTGGAASNLLPSGTAQAFTFTVTPTDDGEVTVQIPADAASDTAGNGNIASVVSRLTFDRTAPTVTSLTASEQSPTNAQSATFTAAFSEPVAFDSGISDISVMGGAASNLSPSGTSRTFTFIVTPTGDGEVTVQIPADAASDTAGNGNVASTVSRLTFDRTAPTVTSLTASEQSPTNAQNATFTAVFSEPVAFGSGISDISVMGGAASNLSPSGTSRTFTFIVTPTGDGEVTVFIPAGSVADLAGNTNTASDTLLITFEMSDPEAFITTWKTTTADESITLPISGSGMTVNWGDGNTTTVSGTAIHTYADAGDHTVSVSGDLDRIHLNNAGVASKLVSIDQWGNIGWTSMQSAFSGASAMRYGATDTPDLSGVTDMSSMFSGAWIFNGNISGWNVSSVTDMSAMFSRATTFDQDISSWNVSSVTTMSNMFAGATSFDQPLNDWNVSSVTDMSRMFQGTRDFNGDISSWNVSKVTDMLRMFSSAASFDQPLNDWNVSSVTTMSNMFAGAASFDQLLNDWNVSSVTYMSHMFAFATSFNQPLNDWDVSSVTRMTLMFQGATSFNQNLGTWYIMPATVNFDADGGSLDVTTVSAQNLSLDGHNPVYGIDPDGIHDSGLFNMTGNTLVFKDEPSIGEYRVNVTASGPSVFENGNNWRVLEITVSGSANSPPTVMAGSDLTVAEGDTVTLSGSAIDPDAGDSVESYTWSAPSGSGITFANASLASTTFMAPAVTTDTTFTLTLTASDGTDSGTDQVDVTVKDTSGAFITTWETTSANESITIPGTGTYTVDWGDGNTGPNVNGTQTHTYVTAGNHTVSISGGLERFHLSDGGTTNDDKLRSIEQWGGTEWTTMEEAFRGASSMVYNATDAPDLSGVTDMSYMFYSASSFNGDLSGWNVSSVTDMSGMFFFAASFNQNLNDWDVSSVTDMSHMFRSATFFNQPLNDWDVSSVTDMNRMFRFASSFNQPLNDWNVSSVTDMSAMFHSASSFNSFNSDLSNWNVSSVTDMRNMFASATSFDRPLNDWDVSSVTDMSAMFHGPPPLTGPSTTGTSPLSPT